jgi:hypothetical protein
MVTAAAVAVNTGICPPDSVDCILSALQTVEQIGRAFMKPDSIL